MRNRFWSQLGGIALVCWGPVVAWGQGGNLLQNPALLPTTDASTQSANHYPPWQQIWSASQAAPFLANGSLEFKGPGSYWLTMQIVGGAAYNYPPSGANAGIQYNVRQGYRPPDAGGPGIYQVVNNLVPGLEYDLKFWSTAMITRADLLFVYSHWDVSLSRSIGGGPNVYGFISYPNTVYYGTWGVTDSWRQQSMMLIAPSSTAYLNFRANLVAQRPGTGHGISLADVEMKMRLLCGSGTTYNGTSPALLNSHLYYAYANFDFCRGRLTSTAVDSRGLMAANPIWDAGCNLTEGAASSSLACSGSNVSPTIAMQPGVGGATPASRQLLTYWPHLRQPVAALQSANFASGGVYRNSAANQALLNYLRGVRTGESSTGQRVRASVLGDIVNSSPVAVGPPANSLLQKKTDALNGSDLSGQADAYSVFRSANSTRVNVVYVGANDGFMHAFRAGAAAPGRSGEQSATVPNDGAELFGYMPSAVWRTLLYNKQGVRGGQNHLDYSAPPYYHDFFLDATPGTGDAYINGQWKTVLAFGTGAGAELDASYRAQSTVTNNRGVVAGGLTVLDVTQPASINESHPMPLLQEWGPDNPPRCALLSGPNAAPGAPTACQAQMGAQLGTPVVVQLHNGHSGVVFGNGFFSQSGSAGLFVYDLQSSTLYYINAATPSRGAEANGIAYVTPADLDGDGITDYVYAGDFNGTVWRFDLTAATPERWGQTVAIFQAPSGSPISTAVQATVIKSTHSGVASNRMMLSFGTGLAWPLTAKRDGPYSTDDSYTYGFSTRAFSHPLHGPTKGPQYVTGPQALYGIWDWQLQDWNRQSQTQAPFAALAALPQSSALLAQSVTGTVTANGNSYRTLSSNPVCWIEGSGACSNPVHYGWVFNLPEANEQVTSNPTVVSAILVVNTVIPTSPTDEASGYTMAIDLASGMAPRTFFSSAGAISNVGGAGLGGVGTPVFMASGGVGTMFQKGLVTQIPQSVPVNYPVPVVNVNRRTWVRLR